MPPRILGVTQYKPLLRNTTHSPYKSYDFLGFENPAVRLDGPKKIMAESETKPAEGSTATIEQSFNNVGDVLNEDGLAAAVEEFVQPPEPASEPEPVTEVETDEQGDPEDLSQSDSEDTPSESRGVQKRIDKLVKQRKDAESDADHLREELAEMRDEFRSIKEGKKESAPANDNPYSDKSTVRELESAEEEAEDWLEWCEDNPDGGVRGEREYDLEDVRRIRKAARKAIRTHIPKQRQYIDAARSYDPVAKEVYPFWTKPTSAEHKVASEFIRTVPGIKQFPDYKIIIGDYLYGRYMREQTISKKQAPAKAPAKAPPQPTTPSAAPRAEQSGDREKAAHLNQFHRSQGSVNDLANVLGQIGL